MHHLTDADILILYNLLSRFFLILGCILGCRTYFLGIMSNPTPDDLLGNTVYATIMGVNSRGQRNPPPLSTPQCFALFSHFWIMFQSRLMPMATIPQQLFTLSACVGGDNTQIYWCATPLTLHAH